MTPLWVISEAAQWLLLLLCLALSAGIIYRLADISRRLPQRTAFLSDQGLPSGTEAPAIRLADYRSRAAVDVTAYRGAPWVLLFLAPDCPNCQRVVPSLKRFAADNPRTPVIVVVAGGARDDYSAKVPPPCAYVIDTAGDVFRAYQVQFTPTMVVVDASGSVLRTGVPNSLIDLEDLLAGRATPGHIGGVPNAAPTLPSGGNQSPPSPSPPQPHHRSTAA